MVGHLKPHVVLLIEASSEAGLEASASSVLKEEVLKRIGDFNDRLMAHERVRGTEAILVTPPGSLPRTSVSLFLVSPQNYVYTGVAHCRRKETSGTE